MVASEFSLDACRSFGSALRTAESSRTLWNRGLMVGRQAEMTATEHSTVVQIAEGTFVYVGSVRESSWIVLRRKIDVTQTLGLSASIWIKDLAGERGRGPGKHTMRQVRKQRTMRSSDSSKPACSRSSALASTRLPHR